MRCLGLGRFLPRRLAVALSLALLSAIVLAAPASAGRNWCYGDPVVSLNGTAVQIWVAVPLEYLPAVNGPIAVLIETPAGVARAIVATDTGLNNVGETVAFADMDGAAIAPDGSFPVTVKAEVPVNKMMLALLGLDKRVPVQITVIANGSLVPSIDGPPAVVGGSIFMATGTSYGSSKVKLTVMSSAAIAATH